MDAKSLKKAIDEVITAHDENARREDKRFRKWDGETPYAIHPIWCAMTLMQETALSQQFRYDGAVALLYHDILEDTTASLPADMPEHIRQLVADMTYENTADEIARVWEKSPAIRLLKLYDKASNVMDIIAMKPEKQVRYREYVKRLIADVESNWGNLNIVKIAKALLEGNEMSHMFV